MSVSGSPVYQLAYESVMMKSYAAAWEPYARTANRYAAGPSGVIRNGQGGLVQATAWRPTLRGGHPGLVAFGGNVGAFVSSGGVGSGYVIGDLITMAPINGGRPVVIRVASLGAGSSVGVTQLIDPGSGLLSGGNGKNTPGTGQDSVLTQASTTGVGTGETFAGNGSVGLGLIAPMPGA